MRGLRLLLAVFVTLTTFLAAVAWQVKQDKEKVEPATLLPALNGPSPRWLKGNLHTHSFWSDGDDFPEMIADWYKRHHYHFLALTDHNVLSEGQRWVDVSERMTKSQALKKYRARFGDSWVETRTDKEKNKQQVRLKPLDEFRSLLEEPGKFLLVPAEEITASVKSRPVHVNGINLRDVIKPAGAVEVPESIRVTHRAVTAQAKKTGKRMLASLNHPNFGWGVYAEDMAAVDELGFFEVYNGHPGVRNDGDAVHPDCDRIWDAVLALRLGKLKRGVVYGLATDDAHAYHAWGVGKVNPGRGWVMVKAPYLSAEAIVRAMEAGDFYATTGVILDEVQRNKEGISLKIRGEKDVSYRTEFVATMRDTKVEGKPFLDKDGKEIPGPLDYGKEVGKVVATSNELTPRYKVTGKELYVRARIVSDKKHPNPFKKGDVEVAWTQPFVEKPQ
jgi:hypothetical protein